MLSKPEKIILKDSKTHIYLLNRVGYKKDETLERIYQNRELSNERENNSVGIIINCKEFDRIDDIARTMISRVEEIEYETYSKHTWTYFQKKEFKLEWMHTHVPLHPKDLSTIVTDWTYVFYVQIPEDISGNEGNIVFEDTEKNKNTFEPREGTLIIFPGHLPHTAIPTPNSETERVVYCGNICFNPHKKKKRKFKKSII